MHCALLILIRPDGPRSLERKNYSLSSRGRNEHWVWNVVRKLFLSLKHFCGLCFGPLNPPSCSSRRGHFLRLQKSHPKEKQWRRRRRKTVPTFTECLRSMRTKLKPPANREVFCIKNILPFCPLHLICIGHNFKWAPPAEAVFSQFRSSHPKNFDG